MADRDGTEVVRGMQDLELDEGEAGGPPKVSTEQLSAMVLPWAKKEHPEKYEQTIKVSMKADTFRRYLVRLLEIRCRSDRDFLGKVPVSLLDETSLVIWVRDRKTGELFEVKGREAPRPHINRFWELALSKSDFEAMKIAKGALDLEHVD